MSQKDLTDGEKRELMEAYDAVSDNASDEDLLRAVEMAKRVASKAVLCTFAGNMQELATRVAEGLQAADLQSTNGDETAPTNGPEDRLTAIKDLVRELLESATPGKAMPLALEFEEFKEPQLQTCLAPVDREHKTEIGIPSESYIEAIYKYYDVLKACGIAFWQHYQKERGDLVERARDLCGLKPTDSLFRELIPDAANPTTMYFSPELQVRVGVIAYYVDAKGNMYTKK